MAVEGGREELQAKLQATERQLREKSERVSQLEQRVEVSCWGPHNLALHQGRHLGAF